MSSSDIAIAVRGLGKSYEIDHQRTHLPTFRDTIVRRLKNPFGRRSFETFWALKDIDLEIQKGDVVGIIGRNGAGKSTLLKILSRITEPTTGRVDLYGRIGSLLEVGTGFHSELTGRENIFLNGAILGMRRKEIQRQFDAIVDFAEVEKFLDTPVKHYSSGMYVRLAFAVAAHLNPEILVVDEVLAVGDAEFQKKCMGKMGDVAKSGRTVLFVSHNINAVSSLCNYAVLLHRGRVQTRGEARSVISEYSSIVRPDVHFDLVEHSGRPKGRQAILQSLALAEQNDEPSATFDPGAPMRIKIVIKTDTRLRSPRVSIGFTSARGERLFAVATYLGVNRIGQIVGAQTVICSLQLPALMPGRYTLDVGIAQEGGAFIDAIYSAGAFDIAETNYLGVTHAYFPEMGNILVRSDWSLEPTAIEATTAAAS